MSGNEIGSVVVASRISVVQTLEASGFVGEDVARALRLDPEEWRSLDLEDFCERLQAECHRLRSALNVVAQRMLELQDENAALSTQAQQLNEELRREQQRRAALASFFDDDDEPDAALEDESTPASVTVKSRRASRSRASA